MDNAELQKLILKRTAPIEEMAGLDYGEGVLTAELLRGKARQLDSLARRANYTSTREKHERTATIYRNAARKIEAVLERHK